MQVESETMGRGAAQGAQCGVGGGADLEQFGCLGGGPDPAYGVLGDPT